MPACMTQQPGDGRQPDQPMEIEFVPGLLGKIARLTLFLRN